MMKQLTAVFLTACVICLPSASVASDAMPARQAEKQYVVLAEDEQTYDMISEEIGTGTAEKISELENEHVVTAKLTEKEASALTKAGNVIVEEDIVLSGSTQEELTEEDVWMQKADAKQKKRESEQDAEIKPEWNLLAVNADGTTETEGTPQKAKVAVLDSGVDYVTGINLAGHVNLIEGEEELSEIFQDATGHGTGIAGIISGNGETGILGVNPNAEVYSVKVLDEENRNVLRISMQTRPM